jgi:hypothetical protein
LRLLAGRMVELGHSDVFRDNENPTFSDN